MKTLDIRRHSLRKDGGGSQLSQAGVDLARRIGATLGPYAQVVTTPVPRTRETAIAMGFAVDYELLMPTADDTLYAEVAANPGGRPSSPLWLWQHSWHARGQSGAMGKAWRLPGAIS